MSETEPSGAATQPTTTKQPVAVDDDSHGGGGTCNGGQFVRVLPSHCASQHDCSMKTRDNDGTTTVSGVATVNVCCDPFSYHEEARKKRRYSKRILGTRKVTQKLIDQCANLPFVGRLPLDACICNNCIIYVQRQCRQFRLWGHVNFDPEKQGLEDNCESLTSFLDVLPTERQSDFEANVATVLADTTQAFSPAYSSFNGVTADDGEKLKLFPNSPGSNDIQISSTTDLPRKHLNAPISPSPSEKVSDMHESTSVLNHVSSSHVSSKPFDESKSIITETSVSRLNPTAAILFPPEAAIRSAASWSALQSKRTLNDNSWMPSEYSEKHPIESGPDGTFYIRVPVVILPAVPSLIPKTTSSQTENSNSVIVKSGTVSQTDCTKKSSTGLESVTLPSVRTSSRQRKRQRRFSHEDFISRTQSVTNSTEKPNSVPCINADIKKESRVNCFDKTTTKNKTVKSKSNAHSKTQSVSVIQGKNKDRCTSSNVDILDRNDSKQATLNEEMQTHMSFNNTNTSTKFTLTLKPNGKISESVDAHNVLNGTIVPASTISKEDDSSNLTICRKRHFQRTSSECIENDEPFKLSRQRKAYLRRRNSIFSRRLAKTKLASRKKKTVINSTVSPEQCVSLQTKKYLVDKETAFESKVEDRPAVFQNTANNVKQTQSIVQSPTPTGLRLSLQENSTSCTDSCSETKTVVSEVTQKNDDILLNTTTYSSANQQLSGTKLVQSQSEPRSEKSVIITTTNPDKLLEKSCPMRLERSVSTASFSNSAINPNNIDNCDLAKNSNFNDLSGYFFQEKDFFVERKPIAKASDAHNTVTFGDYSETSLDLDYQYHEAAEDAGGMAPPPQDYFPASKTCNSIAMPMRSPLFSEREIQMMNEQSFFDENSDIKQKYSAGNVEELQRVLKGSRLTQFEHAKSPDQVKFISQNGSSLSFLSQKPDNGVDLRAYQPADSSEDSNVLVIAENDEKELAQFVCLPSPVPETRMSAVECIERILSFETDVLSSNPSEQKNSTKVPSSITPSSPGGAQTLPANIDLKIELGKSLESEKRILPPINTFSFPSRWIPQDLVYRPRSPPPNPKQKKRMRQPVRSETLTPIRITTTIDKVSKEFKKAIVYIERNTQNSTKKNGQIPVTLPEPEPDVIQSRSKKRDRITYEKKYRHRKYLQQPEKNESEPTETVTPIENLRNERFCSAPERCDYTPSFKSQISAEVDNQPIYLKQSSAMHDIASLNNIMPIEQEVRMMDNIPQLSNEDLDFLCLELDSPPESDEEFGNGSNFRKVVTSFGNGILTADQLSEKLAAPLLQGNFSPPDTDDQSGVFGSETPSTLDYDVIFPAPVTPLSVAVSDDTRTTIVDSVAQTESNTVDKGVGDDVVLSKAQEQAIKSSPQGCAGCCDKCCLYVANLMETFRAAFDSTDSHHTKVQILTLVPDEWSVARTAMFFRTSECLVREARDIPDDRL